jgi:NAD(P)-dependent dehydrogenase (short-subunit alcohol dehydrogenase family)
MVLRAKVALVTGAASGLGCLSSERLRSAGARVAAVDIDDAALSRAFEGRDGFHTFVCDVTDEARLREVVEETERTLGPIDRVVHAPAIMPGGALLEQGAEVARKVMRINYEGAVNMVGATLPRMLERRRGEWICAECILRDAHTRDSRPRRGRPLDVPTHGRHTPHCASNESSIISGDDGEEASRIAGQGARRDRCCGGAR